MLMSSFNACSTTTINEPTKQPQMMKPYKIEPTTQKKPQRITPNTEKFKIQSLLHMEMDSKYSNGGGGGAPPPVADQSLGGSGMRAADTLIRLVPMGLCVAALIVMLKSSQTDDYGSVAYSDLGAFKFLVHANGICAGYSFLSAVVAAMPRPSTMSKAWTVFFLDQLLTYITLAAGTVSTEVLYLAYNGDTEITWSAACGSFGKFCSKATASVVITFVVVVFYAFISILSSYKLFTRYNAPMADPSKQLEISAAFHG